MFIQVRLINITAIDLYKILFNSGFGVHRFLCSIFHRNISQRVGYTIYKILLIGTLLHSTDKNC